MTRVRVPIRIKVIGHLGAEDLDKLEEAVGRAIANQLRRLPGAQAPQSPELVREEAPPEPGAEVEIASYAGPSGAKTRVPVRRNPKPAPALKEPSALDIESRDEAQRLVASRLLDRRFEGESPRSIIAAKQAADEVAADLRRRIAAHWRDAVPVGGADAAARRLLAELRGGAIEEAKAPEVARERFFGRWRRRALNRIYRDAELRRDLAERAGVLLERHGSTVTASVGLVPKPGGPTRATLDVDHIGDEGSAHSRAVRLAVATGDHRYLLHTVDPAHLQLMTADENRKQIEVLRRDSTKWPAHPSGPVLPPAPRSTATPTRPSRRRSRSPRISRSQMPKPSRTSLSRRRSLPAPESADLADVMPDPESIQDSVRDLGWERAKGQFDPEKQQEYAAEEITRLIAGRQEAFDALVAARGSEITAAQENGRQATLRVLVDVDWKDGWFAKGDVQEFELVFSSPRPPQWRSETRPARFRKVVDWFTVDMDYTTEIVEFVVPVVDEEAARQRASRTRIEDKLATAAGEPADFERLIVESLEDDRALDDLRDYTRHRQQLAAVSLHMQEFAHWERLEFLIDSPFDLLEAARSKNIPLGDLHAAAVVRRDRVAWSDPNQLAVWDEVVRAIEERR